jgi:hypothetical protein
MLGVDIAEYTAPLHELFLAGPWKRIGIGDGGNELGMGKLSKHLIAEHVPIGERIACTVSADFLILAGVSNWGAVALAAALALIRPDWTSARARAKNVDAHIKALDTLMSQGLAIDGSSHKRTPTVDGLNLEVYTSVLQAISALL